MAADPAGRSDREQQLLQVTRRGDRLEREILGPVSFVPLLHGLTPKRCRGNDVLRLPKR